MNVSQKISTETIKNIAHDGEILGDTLVFQHPRCGRVRISKKTSPNGPPLWVVESVERPDQ
jgi:hypothetical protein